eukprot:TRINITY_DN35584_c0_g1_i11.p1 TRINITY_DN35584_c0_g1~~TRINITY_DN35584_c0_g1_i11.p1  ORF type:complete len:122 (+),score=6.35 TRINITY_DN35584_c0_g1_i11:59-424(+)
MEVSCSDSGQTHTHTHTITHTNRYTHTHIHMRTHTYTKCLNYYVSNHHHCLMSECFTELQFIISSIFHQYHKNKINFIMHADRFGKKGCTQISQILQYNYTCIMNMKAHRKLCHSRVIPKQ